MAETTTIRIQFMIWTSITKTETNFFKGLAILMIVLHNFLHRFPTPQENEMTFTPENIYNFLDIFRYDPAGIIRALFSFFGHFGVQIFIFLSAYGLTKKYLKSQGSINYICFIKNRFIKIYPMFLLALLSYCIFMYGVNVLYRGLTFSEWFLPIVKPLFLKTTLLYNFYPGQGFSLVGPWWFLSLIFQFYLIFPFFLSFYKKYHTKFLIIISLIALIILMITKGYFGKISVYFTIIGHLPVLCLGVYFANAKEMQMPNWLLIFSIFMYSLGNFNEYLFLSSHFFMCIILLYLFYFMAKKINHKSRAFKTLMFYGTFSMPLFLVNGFLRTPWEKMAHRIDNEIITIALCLLCLAIATSYSIVLKKMDNKAHQFLANRNIM